MPLRQRDVLLLSNQIALPKHGNVVDLLPYACARHSQVTDQARMATSLFSKSPIGVPY